MLSNRAAAALLVLLFSATACSGAPIGGAPGTPTAASAPAARASLVIHVPRRVRAKHGHYVSPSTESLGVQILPTAACKTCSAALYEAAGLTPSSPGCGLDAEDETSCTIVLALNPGTYTGNVSTYDGPLKNDVPTGVVLSTNQGFPITIHAGSANAIGVVLYGIPTGNPNFVLPANTWRNPVNGRFEVLYPGRSVNIFVYMVDEDGNVILGPGAPTYTVTAPAGGFSASSKGSILTLTAPSAVTKVPASFTLTPASPECAQCSTYDEAVSFVPETAIAYPGYNSIFLYTYPGNNFSSIDAEAPSGLAFDAAGDLFVASTTSSGNFVFEYLLPTGYTYNTVSLNGTPAAIAVAPNGNLAVATTNSKVTVYSPANGYATTISTIGFGLGSNAVSLAFDSNNNLWCALSYGNGFLFRYSAAAGYPNGSPDTSVSTDLDHPNGVALDAGNNLYVSNTGSGAIEKYTSPYTGTPTDLGAGVNAALAIDNTFSSYAFASNTTIGTAAASSGTRFSNVTNANACTAALVDVDQDIWGICAGYPFGYAPLSYPNSGPATGYAPSFEVGYGGSANIMATFPAP